MKPFAIMLFVSALSMSILPTPALSQHIADNSSAVQSAVSSYQANSIQTIEGETIIASYTPITPAVPAAPVIEKNKQTAKSLAATTVNNGNDITITAYSSTPDQTDSSPFITANGSTVRDGIIAANFLPFGTKVMIPDLFGQKVFTVEDRMSSNHPYQLDVWMNSRTSAIDFGVKRASFEIVK